MEDKYANIEIYVYIHINYNYVDETNQMNNKYVLASVVSSLELTAREAENLTSWNRTAHGDKDDNDVLEGSEMGKVMNFLAEDRVEQISTEKFIHNMRTFTYYELLYCNNILFVIISATFSSISLAWIKILSRKLFSSWRNSIRTKMLNIYFLW